MLSVTQDLRILTKNCLPALNKEFVRWRRRKPMWMPRAPSKLFIVPDRPNISDEEREELKRLNNRYNTQIKSLRRFLYEKYNVCFQASSDPEQVRKAFEEDLAQCIEVNNKWNADLKVQREKRVKEELEKDIAFAKNRLATEQASAKQRQFEIEMIVKQLKAEAKTFITPETLDDAIDKALENEVDYNYAIDLKGNVIQGRNTRPEDVKPEKSSAAVKQ